MANLLKSIGSALGIGGSDKGLKAQVAAQQAQIQSDQGSALRVQTQAQGRNDQENATLNQPLFGRALLKSRDAGASAGVPTLGG